MLWHYLSFPCPVWDLLLWLWSRGIAIPPFWTSVYLPQLANLRVWLPRMVWAQCLLQVLFPLTGTFMGFPATPQPLDLSRRRSFPGGTAWALSRCPQRFLLLEVPSSPQLHSQGPPWSVGGHTCPGRDEPVSVADPGVATAVWTLGLREALRVPWVSQLLGTYSKLLTWPGDPSLWLRKVREHPHG